MTMLDPKNLFRRSFTTPTVFTCRLITYRMPSRGSQKCTGGLIFTAKRVLGCRLAKTTTALGTCRCRGSMNYCIIFYCSNPLLLALCVPRLFYQPNKKCNWKYVVIVLNNPRLLEVFLMKF